MDQLADLESHLARLAEPLADALTAAEAVCAVQPGDWWLALILERVKALAKAADAADATKRCIAHYRRENDL